MERSEIDPLKVKHVHDHIKYLNIDGEPLILPAKVRKCSNESLRLFVYAAAEHVVCQYRHYSHTKANVSLVYMSCFHESFALLGYPGISEYVLVELIR